MPSSDKSTYSQFNKLKNAVSEIVGRLRVGQNQVHVGFMHYTQRVKTFATVRISEQGAEGKISNLIERLQDLFFVPYEFSPVESALIRSVNEIFLDSSRKYKVPRVALLLNDAASNPKVNNMTSAAFELASRGIEVITIGIGDFIDMNELKEVTNGKEENVIRIDDYENLYSNLDTIVQKICSVSLDIKLNQPEPQRLGSFDYRFFRTSLLDLKTNFIEIQIEELQANSNVNCYYSFVIKNPVKENSGKLMSSRRMVNEASKLATNHYLIYVPTGQPEIYFTLESLNRITNVNVLVEEIDF